MTARGAAAIDRLPDIGAAAICMGVFDGVHRGHLALLDATVRAATERGLRSVALVFDPHPDEVLRPGTRVARLAPLDENLRRLAAAGIDAPIAVHFDAALRGLPPEQFLKVMAPAVTVRALVMTPESAFGRDRAGTPDAMRQYGRGAGFQVVLVDRLTSGAAPISSGGIRRAMARGELDQATRMLGHAPFLEATVSESGGADQTIAFPYTPALPPPGSYRVTLRATFGSSVTGDAILSVGADGSAALRAGTPLDAGVASIELLGPA